MYIESFSGPATKRETDSFYRHIAQFQPSDDNIGNAWVQGDSGEAVKAIGLIYQFTFSVFLLNQMIRFCDKLLSIRNDIAPFPVGQHKIWTGYVDAVWPNKIDRTIRMTGGEQGDAAGHLAYCARLLLANETLRDEPLDYGDPYWFGRTYGERANKYLKEAERTVVNHILNNLVNLTNGKYYFSKDSPYKGQRAVPWNQQMMFNYVFQHMSVAFGMLGDTEKAMKYKTIVTRNVRWFFDEAELYENHKGSHCYRWHYQLNSKKTEDSNHANLVVDGLYRAYLDDMGPTRDEMSYLANTFVDVMVLEDGNYAGNVEGKCGKGKESCTKYVRPAFLLLIQFRPDYYEQIVGKNFKEEKNTNNFKRVSRFLWLKNIRFTQGADWKSAPSKFKVSYVILIAIVSSLIVCCAWLIVKICIELYS